MDVFASRHVNPFFPVLPSIVPDFAAIHERRRLRESHGREVAPRKLPRGSTAAPKRIRYVPGLPERRTELLDSQGVTEQGREENRACHMTWHCTDGFLTPRPVRDQLSGPCRYFFIRTIDARLVVSVGFRHL